jgi:immediate early response 3-interacting protein 1
MAIIPSFGLGSFFQIAVLLLNAVAILSEDRFLARVGLSSASHDPAFGAGPGGDQSFKVKLMNMIASVRMVTRSMLFFFSLFFVSSLSLSLSLSRRGRIPSWGRRIRVAS